MTEQKLTRRNLLKNAATIAGAITFPYIVPSSALGRSGFVAPSERVAIGCIGVGPRGALNTRSMMNHGAQVIAVCDVDRTKRLNMKQYIETFYAEWKRPTVPNRCDHYNDYRELLARTDIDAVMIATPDHWHVPIALAAVKARKDIYVEKPLGISIEQGKTLRDAVIKYGAVFMHGTEQRSMNQFRFACELVRNGRIGELHTIKVACPGGRQTGEHPPMPVPDGLDWNRWLGPAPVRPFNTAVFSTKNRLGWYFIADFAPSGYLTGWGIHHLDMAQWALDADDSGPVEITGQAVFPKSGLFDTPLTWDVDYLYENGVRVNFTDNKKNKQGVRFEGTQGWIHATRSSIDAGPKSLLRTTIAPNEIHLYNTNSDDRNFLECIKTRAETCSPINAAHRSTAVGYLGLIATLLGRKLKWDPRKEVFENDDEANRLLSAPMRSPYRV